MDNNNYYCARHTIAKLNDDSIMNYASILKKKMI